MSNTAVRTVTVTCACGASFDREVKRGRPQVWCPACVEVPFYDRNRTEVPTVTTEEGVEIVVKPVNENDPLGQVRDQVEVAVAEANAAHKLRFVEAVAAGGNPHVVAEEIFPILQDELLAIYRKFRG